ncbi:Vacuolar-sorting receptor 1 [Seminavis robusta]|uniref:Vacuolar-sorting receptor 1 n=1 Tax=Seminavis robusta TaxID=568900 RepID=A0A9N8DYU8_9STRA|nr:Vacuolar-sorting receptor 1 [Seminavis robusta]|eukprot:Sro398_g134700.1 Vacuolar-sorting receptor 1 (538) ;mRNA; f:43771-45608
MEVVSGGISSTSQFQGQEALGSQLFVHTPPILSRQEGYDHRLALFGVPPTNGSITENLIYADSTLCDPNVDTTIGYPVRESDDGGLMAPWPTPFILLVDRGECTFVTKVRHAQRVGASAVVIADNRCLCSDAQCIPDVAGQVCEIREPILADDGSGSDIIIPSVLIFKPDGDALKAKLRNNVPVLLELRFAAPNTLVDGVSYELWYTPGSPNPLLQEFRDIAVVLGRNNNNVTFTPFHYIYDGILAGCYSNDPSAEGLCYNLCTNAGRYCATDPDNELDVGVSGGDVVQESLRRMCIWELYGKDDGIGEPWWDYVQYFESYCGLDRFKDDDCLSDAYKQSGVDPARIQQCMKVDSGGLEGDTTNSLMEQSLEAQRRRGLQEVQAAFVNGALVPGALSAEGLLWAVCAGFAAPPLVCNSCLYNMESDCFEEDVVSCAAAGGNCPGIISDESGVQGNNNSAAAWNSSSSFLNGTKVDNATVVEGKTAAEIPESEAKNDATAVTPKKEAKQSSGGSVRTGWAHSLGFLGFVALLLWPLTI